jgi:hypothetical protein
MKLALTATIALGACTGSALEIPEGASPAAETVASAPATEGAVGRRTACAGDAALQPISIALEDFAPTDPATSAVLEEGALVLGSSATGPWSDSGIFGVQSSGTPVDDSLVVHGVRVCYTLSDPRTHLRQMRLLHPLGGPAWEVDEEDTTQLDDAGHFCTDPTYFEEVIKQRCLALDGSIGPFMVFLAADFGDTADTITIQSVDVMVSRRP